MYSGLIKGSGYHPQPISVHLFKIDCLIVHHCETLYILPLTVIHTCTYSHMCTGTSYLCIIFLAIHFVSSFSDSIHCRLKQIKTVIGKIHTRPSLQQKETTDINRRNSHINPKLDISQSISHFSHIFPLIFSSHLFSKLTYTTQQYRENTARPTVGSTLMEPIYKRLSNTCFRNLAPTSNLEEHT